MNEYKAKQEAKRQRLRDRAEKSRTEARSAAASARQIQSAIPLGQPILAGHHSEKRHRKDLDKIQRGYHKACMAEDTARELERRADAVGTSGISSDDPDATQKLKEKLASLERRRSYARVINKAYRKGGWDEVRKVVSDVAVDKMIVVAERYHSNTDSPPFPSYLFTNLGANIRRIRKRIETIRAEQIQSPTAPVKYDGFSVVPRPDINRITVVFEEKPSRDTCKLMRQYGFKFSRREMAWMRHLNNAGRHAASSVATLLNEKR